MMVNSTFAKSSFFLPHHGNRKHITSHSTTKAHLHIHLKSLKPFDLLGFPLQQNDTLHMPSHRKQIHRISPHCLIPRSPKHRQIPRQRIRPAGHIDNLFRLHRRNGPNKLLRTSRAWRIHKYHIYCICLLYTSISWSILPKAAVFASDR